MGNKYLGNTNTKEIHEYAKMVDGCKLNQMKDKHKFWLSSESEVRDHCKNKGYNGCKWCLNQYHVD